MSVKNRILYINKNEITWCTQLHSLNKPYSTTLVDKIEKELMP